MRLFVETSVETVVVCQYSDKLCCFCNGPIGYDGVTAQ